MDGDPRVSALQWEVTKEASASPKTWAELARTTAAVAVVDPVERANAVTLVYERALRAFASSYKLWTAYISYRQQETSRLCGLNEWFQAVREVYERALAELPKMPMLWVSYMEFVVASEVPRVTMTRHILARALAALPATQHHHLWKVAKRWCAMPVVPSATVRAVWRLYLSFQRSLHSKREYFQVLVQKGDFNGFLHECVHLGLPNKSNKGAVEERDLLLSDMSFWETVQTALQGKGWRFTGDIGPLRELVALGKRRCASPVELSMAFAVFLYGQGHMREGRQELRQLLDEAPEAQTLISLYHLAVEVEDQLVESFAVDPDLRRLDDAAYNGVVQHLFGDGDPLSHLERLAREFPLLLNQSQLRNSPHNATLWLKRVELVQEDVYAGRSTFDDLVDLYRQAIQQCTAGMSRVDGAAAQLFSSCAQALIRGGKLDSAVSVLSEGAWCVPFTSAALNVQLLGLLVEVQLMSAASPLSVRDALADRLTSGARSGASKRSRNGLLQSSAALPHVVHHPHTWIMWCDVCAAYDSANAAAWRRLVEALATSPAFSAEAACYVAHKAYVCRQESMAVIMLERAVAATRQQPTAQLFVLEQYLSFLYLRDGRQVPLHQFREVFSLLQQVTPVAIRTAPSAVIDLHVSCAYMEAAIGLYGTAVRMMQEISLVATAALRGRDEHLRILQAILEHSITFTEQRRGYDSVRTYCGVLVQRLQHALLLQRVALHWAAIEKRSGNTAQAHLILDACGDSQDPSTEHGEVYWRLWESLCTSVEEFEKVARRRQQALIRFSKRENAKGAE
ncbi:conserved hypothetical protein [Leishmania mexicana MHOM/GT/2001/U1103]|uniref:Pre-mRNA-splicing factor Syf1-like N-terminal HAT-repeats domain-containing protein n=1 Tax=Leishmania mexicana (strain MHOM/GT/2001/U1103) TaxID=929439 RepID=E9AWI7_LEIMU|nr:conserved hypothetical protein [Leishmania mexicana MHOM/GT/2001/U1103]CBZ27323.1 conserved hypothetical protein [Leishmania mexicana MHOM/GT/2001/U1103]